jgi:sigma-B regulation protein RsbU (phosphoserine phosphatase)
VLDALERFFERIGGGFDRLVGGVQARDMQRLFQRDAVRAYEVLTRDQPKVEEPSRYPRRLLHRTRLALLGLSEKLTPPRRLLFLAAMVFALLGLVEIRFHAGSTRVDLSGSPLWSMLSVATLVLLLALELVDRVLVRDELEVARQLQRDLLPARSPDLPGYAFAHSYRTANEIGGDYYAFHPRPDGSLLIVAGDASGHGMAAGLLMAIADATIKVALDIEAPPQRAVALLNRALHRTGNLRNYMSIFYAVLTPETGALSYVCAGHPFPLLRRAAGGVEELGTGAFPLGVRTDIDCALAHAALEPGDLLVIYSDGFPEAQNAGGDVFGFDRVTEVVRGGGHALELHSRLVDTLNAYLGEEPLHDDVSVVVLERQAGP